MLSGTHEVTITGLNNKQVKLVRVNPSENALTNIGAVSLFSGETQITSRRAFGTDFVRVDEITPSYSYSSVSDSDDRPRAIPFIDDTDYESLERELEAYSLQAGGGRSSRIVQNSTVSFSVGDTKTFNVRDNDNVWSEVSSTLKAEGTYCYIWGNVRSAYGALWR